MRKRHVFIFVFLLAFSFVTRVCAQQETVSRWQELTQTAFELYQQGNIEQAIKITEEALDVASEDYGPESIQAAQSMGNLSALYGLVDRKEEAWHLYKKSWEIRNRYNAGVPDDIQRAVFFEQVNAKK